ncbi:MAG: hypothetical protein DMG06_01020 [Acidobacteria bacterium]|nr:MAG: hypothetical protein DMG06_01020 [Acidobacteriota bacterium]
MAEVVTFGEAMIRLSPPGFQRLEQTSSLDVQVGGGELNVAVAVSRLGLSSAWVSKLPENALGRLIRNKAREQGVFTSWNLALRLVPVLCFTIGLCLRSVKSQWAKWIGKKFLEGRSGFMSAGSHRL